MTDPVLTGDLFDTLTDKGDDRIDKLIEIARLHALCQIVGAKFECNEDMEGGGYMRIEFPREQGWTTERAEQYVLSVMKLDLSNSYRGAGQSFQQCNTYQRNGHGDWPVISWRWGYDI
jgi:hypothetical protein